MNQSPSTPARSLASTRRSQSAQGSPSKIVQRNSKHFAKHFCKYFASMRWCGLNVKVQRPEWLSDRQGKALGGKNRLSPSRTSCINLFSSRRSVCVCECKHASAVQIDGPHLSRRAQPVFAERAGAEAPTLLSTIAQKQNCSLPPRCEIN